MDNRQASAETGDEGRDIGQNQQGEKETFLRNKRKCLRGRITRAINRVKENIQDQADSRRLQKQIESIKADYNQALEYHNELYEFIHEDRTGQLFHWKAEIENDVLTTDETVEDYIKDIQGGVQRQSVTTEQQLVFY